MMEVLHSIVLAIIYLGFARLLWVAPSVMKAVAEDRSFELPEKKILEKFNKKTQKMESTNDERQGR